MEDENEFLRYDGFRIEYRCHVHPSQQDYLIDINSVVKENGQGGKNEGDTERKQRDKDDKKREEKDIVADGRSVEIQDDKKRDKGKDEIDRCRDHHGKRKYGFRHIDLINEASVA
jgi:hypothetical protein